MMSPTEEETRVVIISRLRLGLLRVVYGLLALGAGSLSWMRLIDTSATFDLMEGLAVSMLAAFAALCLLGIRDPLRMLPILFWEIIWKLVWLTRIAWPAWRGGRVDEGILTNIVACGLVFIVIAAVPWRYAWTTYGLGGPSRARGDFEQSRA
jgi:hypothetical protein